MASMDNDKRQKDQRETILPRRTFNDLVRGKSQRISTLVRTIKFCSVNETAGVVTFARRVNRWTLSIICSVMDGWMKLSEFKRSDNQTNRKMLITLNLETCVMSPNMQYKYTTTYLCRGEPLCT